MNVKSSYFTLEIKLLWLRTTVKYTHHKNGELHFLKLIKKVKRTHPILILFNPLVMNVLIYILSWIHYFSVTFIVFLSVNQIGNTLNIHVTLECFHYSQGGSLGKGTAVKDHSDVDLLVVINNFRKIDDLREQLPKIISSFAEYLLAAVRGETIRIKIIKQTLYTLQFQVCCVEDGDWFDVDFLPIIDVISKLYNEQKIKIIELQL